MCVQFHSVNTQQTFHLPINRMERKKNWVGTWLDYDKRLQFVSYWNESNSIPSFEWAVYAKVNGICVFCECFHVNAFFLHLPFWVSTQICIICFIHDSELNNRNYGILAESQVCDNLKWNYFIIPLVDAICTFADVHQWKFMWFIVMYCQKGSNNFNGEPVFVWNWDYTYITNSSTESVV